MRIDAVVTWVDGDDPAFRARFAARGGRGLKPGGKDLTARYKQSQELRYCLRSIIRFAPWIRRIWIVTDSQLPEFIDRERAAGAGIRFVSHQEIFTGFESVLPTFASTSIESMLWRIDGLAEHFIYFNDDFFLLKPLVRKDFFDPLPVLRGKRRDLTTPWATWLWRRRNAATTLGMTPDNVFLEAHVATPMLRSAMAALFNRYRYEFVRNIAFRFRSKRAFHPITLHNQHLLASGDASETGATATAVMDGCSPDRTEAEALAQLSRMRDSRYKLGCVNNLDSFLRVAPGAPALLEEMFGPPLDFEISDTAIAGDERADARA